MFRLTACIVLVIASAVVMARADGRVLSTATAKVTIPDQQALIHYADGVETLVVETRFVGAGKDFAWIVPVPTEPEVFPATTGLFPTLRWLNRPDVVHNVSRYYIWAIWLSLVVFLWITKRVLGCLLLTMTLLVLMLIPSLGSAGISATAVGPVVEVHDRKVVGSFDTATISSKDPDALRRWLTDNGFVIPSEIKTVIEQYVQEGWFFVAARLKRDADSDQPATPHPLGFRFKTNKPVYPLRMTAVGNNSVAIDLYVFGPNRAEIAGFQALRCYQPKYPTLKPDEDPIRSDLWTQIQDPSIVTHPFLREIVKDAAVATKLSATLTAEQMRQDAQLNWREFKEIQQTVYSTQAVRVLSANIALSILAPTLALVAGFYLRRSPAAPAPAPAAMSATSSNAKPSDVHPLWLWLNQDITLPQLNLKVPGRVGKAMIAGAVVVSVGCAAYCWLTLPRTEVHVTRFPQIRLQVAIGHAKKIAEDVLAQAQVNQRVDLGRLRSQIANELGDAVTNELTGERTRDEDSPGNYRLRQTPAGIEFVWYDPVGGEHSSLLTKGPASGDSASAGSPPASLPANR